MYDYMATEIPEIFNLRIKGKDKSKKMLNLTIRLTVKNYNTH